MVELKVKEVETIVGRRACPECNGELIKLKNGNWRCFRCRIEIEN